MMSMFVRFVKKLRRENLADFERAKEAHKEIKLYYNENIDANSSCRRMRTTRA